MNWWQTKRRDEDLERELRSDLEMKKKSSDRVGYHQRNPGTPLGVLWATRP